MNKIFAGAWIVLLLICGLSGCHAVGNKTASLTVIYAAVAVLAVLLLIGYGVGVKKKNKWFTLLFSAVSVVNIGYYWLSVSESLNEALAANRVAYCGSVLLPLAMLMIILRVTDTVYSKWVPWSLLGLSAVVLFVAASPGYLDIYYKEVSFAVVDGVGTLEKVYGPLHPMYLFYLLGYFGSMVAVIIRARAKKTIDTPAHAVIIAIAVLVNIGVWLIEQLVLIDFEMLSVSYIISELFLLGVHLVMSENQRLKDMIRQKEEVSATATEAAAAEELPFAKEEAEERTAFFINGYEALTPRERELFKAYVAGEKTKDILARLNIKENTLKYHSRNLYGKLGVSSRKQLVAVYRYIDESGDVNFE